MEKEEQLFRKRVRELAELCYAKDIPAHTDFLTLNEQTIFKKYLCPVFRGIRKGNGRK